MSSNIAEFTDGYNSIDLVGEVVREARAIETKKGRVVKLWLVTKNGQYQTKHLVVVFGNLCKFVLDSCKVGVKLYVNGRINNRLIDKNGGGRSFISEVITHKLLLVRSLNDPKKDA